MDELFEQFMIESRELISQATDDLLALEREPGAGGRIEAAFRAVHTLKGSVAIFDLAPMAATLHAAEDLLGRARAAGGPIDAAIVQALLRCLDQCDRWIDAVEENGALPIEAPRDAVRIASRLASLIGDDHGAEAGPVQAAAPWLGDLLEAVADEVAAARADGRAVVAIRYVPREDCFFTGDDPVALAAAIPELVALRIQAREPWPKLDAIDPYRCNLLVEAVSSAPVPALRQLFRFIPDQVEIADCPGERQASDALGGRDPAQRTIRVEAAQIDRLLDLVGELLVAKNGLLHLAAEAETGKSPAELAAAIRATGAATDRLVGDMHRAVMGVRMISLDRLFGRIARMVREIGGRLDRDIAFDVQGAGTKIDKAIADALFEPLLHIVRNAVDHGIESPEARRAAGKPAQGRLQLSARSLGDHIAIELSDDGGGLDPARVRRRAVEQGLVAAADAAAIDDEAAIELIFAQGFSTAASVTDISGRGVGMDAVRSAIEQLGGRVILSSRVGAGTSVALRLPATAALTTVLIVRVNGERFAVPLDLVVETARVAAADVTPIGQGRAVVIRQRTLPLLELSALLALGASRASDNLNLLVVDGGQGPVALVVDEFSDRLEVMVRPLTGLLGNVPGISGSTLLGDGSVLFILDLPEVIG